MALVSFEQDEHPDAPPGAGYFLADSGERAYAYDPNLAESLSGQPPPASPMQEPEQPSYDLMSAADDDGGDQRLAGFGGGPAGQDLNSQNMAVDAAGGQQQQVPPSASDAGGASSAAYGVPGPYMAATPPAAPAPAAQEGQPPPMLARPSEGQPAPAPAVDPLLEQRAQQQAYVNAPVRVAATKAGLRPKSAEMTSEGAVPMADADWKELAAIDKAENQAAITKANLQVAQGNVQLAHAMAVMPKLQQQYETNKAEYDAARASARQDLTKVNVMLHDVANRKVDHGRFFRERGVFGQLAAGIAQALGASAATLSGSGRNMVADQMNRMIDEDVAEQREDIENGRANANNALQLLRDKYSFSIPQAESALKIAQLGVANAQLQGYEGMKMSQDAQVGLQALLADNRHKQFIEARKIYTESVGKVTQKQQLTYQQGSPGGMRVATEKERQERLHTVQMGQETGTMGDISREGRALDAKGKNNPNAAKAQEQLDAINHSLEVTKRMDALYAQKTPLTPAQRGWLEAQQDVAPMETHKALTGMSRYSEFEGHKYATAFGEKGETSDLMGKRRGALGMLRESLAARKAQVEAALRSGQGRPAEQPEADIQDVP